MMCPICAAAVPVQQENCGSCGTRLTEYAAVWYLPDEAFNDGIAALRVGRREEAAGHFALACRLRADDDEACREWADACAEPGRASVHVPVKSPSRRRKRHRR